jgi:plastocyanin
MIIGHLSLSLAAQESSDKKAVSDVENLQPQTIEITATNFKFTPSEFTVPVGRKIKITLINKAKEEHNIQFDLPDNHKLKLPKNLKAGESGSLEFVAPGPGTYTFICPVDLHHTLGMKGKMITK